MSGVINKHHYEASTSNLIRWPAVSSTLEQVLQAEEIEFAPVQPRSEEDRHLFRPRADRRQASRGDVVDHGKPLHIDHGMAWALVNFYQSSIQNIYPLIPPQDLEDMVGEFLQDIRCETAAALVLLVFSVASICLSRDKSHKHRPKSDAKPGYRYYILANRLLSTQFGKGGLNIIRAHILASLYCNQLGKVTDSFRHIRFAGAEISDRLFRHIERLIIPQKQPLNREATELLVAFWSCWQVESDLLMDQYFSPSGILKFDRVVLPGSALRNLGFSAAVAASFTANIQVRVQTNKICGLLNDAKKNLDTLQEGVVMALGKELGDKGWETPDLVKNDDSANQVLLARIQQKSWDAEVIAYCPWLKVALELSQACPDCSCETCPGIPPGTMENTRKCVNAMLNSIKAFQTVGEKRSMITNIVGTAHFQFGNLVALYTILWDRHLSILIDKPSFPTFFRKTIEIFEAVAHGIEGLALDLKVLKRLERELPGHNHVLTSGEPCRRRTG